jgi:hypothetical protein
MNTPRYLIAKYIGDLRRVEPRNIGVILWTPNGIAARFLAEKSGREGEVDGRSIPSFVTSVSAYKQWIEFWRAELDKSEIESVDEAGKKAALGDPSYLDILMNSSKGNFVLVDGGFLLDPVEDVDDAVDFLFSTLVESGVQEDPRDVSLDEVCDRLIEETNLSNDPYFRSAYPVPCAVAPNVEERFEFSYAYGNGSIKRLYQRVPISRKKTLQRKTVHDAAWMFGCVTRSKIIEMNNAVSLVFVPQGQASDTDVEKWLSVLGTVSRVVNVGDEGAAKREFEELPSLAR